MKIRFLKNCTAPQQYVPLDEDRMYSPVPSWETQFFMAGDEEDPNVYDQEIDLTKLKYKEDYEIIEYP